MNVNECRQCRPCSEWETHGTLPHLRRDPQVPCAKKPSEERQRGASAQHLEELCDALHRWTRDLRRPRAWKLAEAFQHERGATVDMRRLRGVCCVLRQVTWSRNRIWNIQFAGIKCIWPLNIYIYIIYLYACVCACVFVWGLIWFGQNLEDNPGVSKNGRVHPITMEHENQPRDSNKPMLWNSMPYAVLCMQVYHYVFQNLGLCYVLIV